MEFTFIFLRVFFQDLVYAGPQRRILGAERVRVDGVEGLVEPPGARSVAEQDRERLPEMRQV